MSGRRTCTKCGTLKDAAEFRRSSSRKSGYQEACKVCVGERDRAYYRKNRYRVIQNSARWRDENRAKSDGYKLKNKFRITLDDFKSLEGACGGRCQICGNPETRKGRKNLSVDHDHETGDVRGLLCASCNMGLGSFQDSEQLLVAAISYLKRTRRRATA